MSVHWDRKSNEQTKSEPFIVIGTIIKCLCLVYGTSTERLGQIYMCEQKRTQTENEEFPPEAVGKGKL